MVFADLLVDFESRHTKAMSNIVGDEPQRNRLAFLQRNLGRCKFEPAGMNLDGARLILREKFRRRLRDGAEYKQHE
jgi:hypothetical protein